MLQNVITPMKRKLQLGNEMNPSYFCLPFWNTKINIDWNCRKAYTMNLINKLYTSNNELVPTIRVLFRSEQGEHEKEPSRN